MACTALAVKRPVHTTRIGELDGFRALAVLGVLFHHGVYGWPSVRGAIDSIPWPARFALYNGWRGVDLFFVLSGLLITGILLDAKGKPNFFKNFYGRRLLRIFPLYLTVLVVCALAYKGYASYFWLCVGMMANFANAFGVPTPHGPGVFWSLAVEEHFYLLWPFLVALLDRRKLTILAVAVIALAPVVRGIAAAWGMDIENQIYAYSPFRFDGLATGGLLAIWMRSGWHEPRRSFWVAGGVVLFVILISIAGTPWGVMGTKTTASAALRGTQVQLLVSAAMLAAMSFPAGSSWTALLRSLPAKITAEYSYCIYLIHLSLGDAYMWFVRQVHIDAAGLWGPVGSIGVRVLVMTVLSYVIAALSFRFLEQPFLRLKRYF